MYYTTIHITWYIHTCMHHAYSKHFWSREFVQNLLCSFNFHYCCCGQGGGDGGCKTMLLLLLVFQFGCAIFYGTNWCCISKRNKIWNGKRKHEMYSKKTHTKPSHNHGALLLFMNEKSNSFNTSFFFFFGSLLWRMLHSYTPSHPLRLLTHRCNHLPSFCPCTKVRLTFRDQTTNSN